MKTFVGGADMTGYQPGVDSGTEQVGPDLTAAIRSVVQRYGEGDPMRLTLVRVAMEMGGLGYDTTDPEVLDRAVVIAEFEPGRLLHADAGPDQDRDDKMRHKQFAHLRHQGERFYPGQDLLDHIAMLREHFCDRQTA